MSELVKFCQSCAMTQCVIGYKQRNNKQTNCPCLHQVVNSGTQNYANNKDF